MDMPRIRVVSAEIERDGRYLITQRRADAVLPLLWEFPGGRVREPETDAATLVRTIYDRLGVPVHVGPCTMEVEHTYEGYALTLAVYHCEVLGNLKPRPIRVESIAWALPEEFVAYSFPGADQQTVDQLLESLEA